MSFGSINEQVKKLYDYASDQGFNRDLFFSADNQDGYMITSIEAFRQYPLFLHVFGGKYDEKTFMRMMSVDFKSRLNTLAGITTGGDYESVMLLEAPKTKKTGMLQYVMAADPGDYTLLVKPAMYKLEDFEKFAHEQRKDYLDDNTWYIYIFATKSEYMGHGYGRRLMDLILSYADKTGCRICLETNLNENVKMYEHFGFKTVSSSVYKDTLEHYVMLYTGLKAI